MSGARNVVEEWAFMEVYGEMQRWLSADVDLLMSEFPLSTPRPIESEALALNIHLSEWDIRELSANLADAPEDIRMREHLRRHSARA